MLTAALLAALAGTPIADVWPYASKRLPTGELEYSYDLSGVKAAGGTSDAINAHGEAKVKDFLKGLPKETKVVLKQGAAVTLGAGRGAENVPLVNALGSISDAKVQSTDPLAKAPGARMRPALHPEEPKLLLSAEAAMWRARRLVEGAEAAIALDSEKVHAALWAKVIERAIGRLKTANGDAREGAVALAGRLVAAGSCLDSTKVPKGQEEVAKAAEAELVAARGDPDLAVAPGLWSWSKELTCARVRVRMLGKPFPQSRAGVAAALTLLGLLSADPKLEAQWNQLRARREALLGGSEKEPLLDYRERSKGNVEDAMENMAAFIDQLGVRLPPVPAPLEAGTTPFQTFFAELEAASRASAVDELLAAAQDGRLTYGNPVFARAEAGLAGLVGDEGKALQLDAAWRDRRAAGFAALAGGHRESNDEGRDLSEASDERTDLKIRLLVPPTLEVEPATKAYTAEAEALTRLADAVTALKLTGLTAVQGEGGRSAEPIAAEAKKLAVVFKGLAKLSADLPPAAADASGSPNADLDAARKFAKGWKADPAFGKDVREARALGVNQGAQRQHAAIVGAARRELLVGFQGAISTTVGVAGPFDVAPAEQRYLVPVLITRAALGKATAQPIDRLNLKAMCETAKRQPNEIEAAMVEAMKTR